MHKFDILMDSGAYSAWTKKKPIQLSDYVAYLHKHTQRLERYFNLDVIIPEDREEGARVSHENLTTMHKEGLNPIPVFHQGENIKWLDKILDAGCDYVAVAGASTLPSMTDCRYWYDVVWNRLVNSGGFPFVKVHALGDVSIVSVSSYPWYSVDSSGHSRTTGFGTTMVFTEGRGNRVTFGNRRRGKFVHHELDEDELRAVNKQIEDAGLVPEDMQKSFKKRLVQSLASFEKWEDFLQQRRPSQRLTRGSGFLSSNHANNRPGLEIYGPKMYLAFAPSPDFLWALEKSRFPHILISYFYFKSAPTTKKWLYGESDEGQNPG